MIYVRVSTFHLQINKQQKKSHYNVKKKKYCHILFVEFL